MATPTPKSNYADPVLPPKRSGEEEMRYYYDVVAADMDAVRDTVDRLETLTAGKYWPYPTFYDLLFSV